MKSYKNIVVLYYFIHWYVSLSHIMCDPLNRLNKVSVKEVVEKDEVVATVVKRGAQ